MEQKYNVRSPGIKRLMREAIELAESTEEYCANPLEDNLFEWHFTVRGPPNTDFQGGIYHGRIILPTQYPMKPPDIILLTPNGRFETNTKICLSISGHHPETWQPSWSIRTALLALIAFMPTKTIGAIGSLDYTPEERQVLAKKSRTWECDTCGKICDKLASKDSDRKTSQTENALLQEIAALHEKQEEEKREKQDKEIKKLFETRSPMYDNDSLENLVPVATTEEVAVATQEPQSLRDQILPIFIFFIIVAIVVLLMRRFIIFGLYKSDKQSSY